MWGQIFCEIFKTKSHQWVASGQSQPFNIFINILRVQIHISHSEKGLTFPMINATNYLFDPFSFYQEES